MPSHASASILANPTAARLDLRAFENRRTSTNKKTHRYQAAFLPAAAGCTVPTATTLARLHADRLERHPRDTPLLEARAGSDRVRAGGEGGARGPGRGVARGPAGLHLLLGGGGLANATQARQLPRGHVARARGMLGAPRRASLPWGPTALASPGGRLHPSAEEPEAPR